MSSLEIRVEEIRDQIASAQATIDQARAHLSAHKELLTPEMFEHFSRDIAEKQNELDRQVRILIREFPKH